MKDSVKLNILLADDDPDDLFIFKEAFDELNLNATLDTVSDGEELMDLLHSTEKEKYHILFLDLNMPRKNGPICVKEIKDDDKLKNLPIIILSTSYDESIGHTLYDHGAHFYICKPAAFTKLKALIDQAINLVEEYGSSKPPRELFLLTP
jgi:CheY-like chemotaxis protein